MRRRAGSRGVVVPIVAYGSDRGEFVLYRAPDGAVSLHDVAVRARSGKSAGISAEEVLDTFIAIAAPAPRHEAMPA